MALLSFDFKICLSGESPPEDVTDGRPEGRDRNGVRLLHVQPSVFCQPAGGEGETFPSCFHLHLLEYLPQKGRFRLTSSATVFVCTRGANRISR